MQIESVNEPIIAVRRSQYPEDKKSEFLLVGRSNVGKSSFINTLIERKNFARTSSKPGKTQTLNFYKVNDAFYLVDVPGYGYASVSKDTHGMLTDEGFVVLKGSKVKEGVFESLSPSLNGFFEKERSSTDLVDNVYINDHLFSSPSMAAIAILGRNANGYTEWKNKDNVSLKKIIGGE